MAVAKAQGRLCDKKPQHSTSQQRHLLTLHGAGKHIQDKLAELFSASRTPVYRTIQRGAS